MPVDDKKPKRAGIVRAQRTVRDWGISSRSGSRSAGFGRGAGRASPSARAMAARSASREVGVSWASRPAKTAGC